MSASSTKRFLDLASGGASGGLRVAMLGWARLSMREREGSGYNLSVGELAAALAQRGHRVAYLRSGIDYSLRPGMWIEPHELWRGVPCFTLFNSPNLATGNWNFGNVRGASSSPEQSAVVFGWLREVRPDVVHVHSIEGFGFDLLPAIRREMPGVRLVVTPHNYFYLCPQVDLLARERRVCTNYEGGRSCEGCLAMPDAARERRARRWRQTLRRWFGPRVTQALRDAARALPLRIAGRGWPRPVIEVHDAGGPTPTLAPADAELAHEPETDQFDDARSLTQSSDVHLRVVNGYGSRRLAGVAALNAADAVLCPGAFLRRVHEAFGVDAARLRHVPLGQPHFDALRDAASKSPYRREAWTPKSGRPLRLAFFGNCLPHKGLAVLVEALVGLPDGIALRTHTTIHAAGDDRPHRARVASRPGLNVQFQGAYSPETLGPALAATDVVVFTSICLENSPFVVLEALHAGRPILGSRLGAVPEFVREGANGWLFEPGSPKSLRERITRLVEGADSLLSIDRVQAASDPSTHAQYVNEVLGEYGKGREA